MRKAEWPSQVIFIVFALAEIGSDPVLAADLFAAGLFAAGLGPRAMLAENHE